MAEVKPADKNVDEKRGNHTLYIINEFRIFILHLKYSPIWLSSINQIYIYLKDSEPREKDQLQESQRLESSTGNQLPN